MLKEWAMEENDFLKSKLHEEMMEQFKATQPSQNDIEAMFKKSLLESVYCEVRGSFPDLEKIDNDKVDDEILKLLEERRNKNAD